MDNNDLSNQVPGAVGGVSKPETPSATENGVSTQAQPVGETPVTKPPVDVDALVAKYEKDIANVKSALQRQTAQVEQQWQSRYGELQSEMHKIRMQGMTEEERGRYERQLESEEFQSLQSRLAELENEKAQQASTVSAYSWFIQQGVPAEKLNLTEGYEAIVNAGWSHLNDELARLRAAAANPQPVQPVQPAALKDAPPVITDKGTPGSSTTWSALRAQYGSDEAVYRAVEEGRLPSSVIPSI